MKRINYFIFHDFKLCSDFLGQYKDTQYTQPKWGSLGHVIYKRTYARYLNEENRKEEYWETLKRVVEGCFSNQKDHCLKLSLLLQDVDYGLWEPLG